MRSHVLVLISALLFALITGETAQAHDVRPAYLQIDEIGPERYSVLWRTPLLSGAPLPVVLVFPDDVRTLAGPVVQEMSGSRLQRRTIEVPGGLAGRTIEFVGLEGTITDVLARISGPENRYLTTMVRPSAPRLTAEAPPGAFAIAMTYLLSGAEHILFGIDHLLFVAALLLIVRDWRMMVKTITAFTIAHSITLGLSTFGLVKLPSRPVETMIALSIMLVAVEAVRRERGKTSISISWPWVVAFAFGLLHGFGFAGALVELGLPQGDIPLALLSFNIGVEIGQLLFIGLVVLAVTALQRMIAMPRQAVTVCAYAIGILASFWTFERLSTVFA